MAMFDLEKTSQLELLFTVPREQRNADWIRAFYEAAAEASLAAREQQTIVGPDGFRYFALYMPPSRQEFDAFCILHLLDVCLSSGMGCVIHPDQSPPQWVFTYGNLWSLRSYSTFDATQPQSESRPALGAGRTVLMAAPSDKFLPAFARDVLKRYLQQVGVKTPRVLLINDAQGTPSQSLAFDFYPEDFTNRDIFDAVMNRLKNWFLPPHYGLVGLPKNSQYETHFVPL